MPEITCSKNVTDPCGQPAVEFLIVGSTPSSWSAKPRCKDHPAAADVKMLHRVSPSLTCLIVQVPDA